jgi:hypothetical protein
MAARPRTPGGEHTTRKEDYKSYSERDVEDGWPYSDEPGTEEERLSGNREYAPEDEQELPADADGFHLETADPEPIEGPEEDETLQDYIRDEDERTHEDERKKH